MARDIFISYSRQDLNKVKAIKKEIEKATGAQCWMDLQGIESGSPEFDSAITEGINNCKVFLFMRSENSMKSTWAIQEINFAAIKFVILMFD